MFAKSEKVSSCHQKNLFDALYIRICGSSLLRKESAGNELNSTTPTKDPDVPPIDSGSKEDTAATNSEDSDIVDGDRNKPNVTCLSVASPIATPKCFALPLTQNLNHLELLMNAYCKYV